MITDYRCFPTIKNYFIFSYVPLFWNKCVVNPQGCFIFFPAIYFFSTVLHRLSLPLQQMHLESASNYFPLIDSQLYQLGCFKSPKMTNGCCPSLSISLIVAIHRQNLYRVFPPRKVTRDNSKRTF